MKVKLDEHLGERGRQLLSDAGHDVATVAEEDLTSAADEELIQVCQNEQRCLVTLDLDFSNPFLFPPGEYSGIAVIRLPRRSTPKDLYASVEPLINPMESDAIVGKLWIVERHRVREYTPGED